MRHINEYNEFTKREEVNNDIRDILLDLNDIGYYTECSNEWISKYAETYNITIQSSIKSTFRLEVLEVFDRLVTYFNQKFKIASELKIWIGGRLVTDVKTLSMKHVENGTFECIEIEFCSLPISEKEIGVYIKNEPEKSISSSKIKWSGLSKSDVNLRDGGFQRYDPKNN